MEEIMSFSHCILIIDDDAAFLQNMKNGLQDHADHTLIIPYQFKITTQTEYEAPDLNQIWQSITDTLDGQLPTHILLDVNLGNSHASISLAELFADKDSELGFAKIWLISRGEGDNQGQSPQSLTTIIEQYQKQNANVQDSLLSKNDNAKTIFAKMTDTTVYHKDWNHFPLPVRVLSTKGQGLVLHANNKWDNKYTEWPKPSISAEKIMQELTHGQSDTLKPQTYIGDFTDASTPDLYSSTTLNSFIEKSDNDEFIVQVATINKTNHKEPTIKEALKQVFQTLQTEGFTRLRYYGIDSIAKDSEETNLGETNKTAKDRVLVALTHEYSEVSHEGLNDSWIDNRWLLKGALLDKLKDFVPLREKVIEHALQAKTQAISEAKTAAPALEHNKLETIGQRAYDQMHNKLIYKIGTLNNQDKDQDALIQEINRIVGLSDEDTWLKIPIFSAVSSAAKNPTGQSIQYSFPLKGLLEIDKKGSDHVDLSISDKNIKAIEAVLSKQVTFLRHIIKQDLIRDTFHYEKQMRIFDKALIDAKNEDERFDKIVETLCQLTGADSGTLSIEHSFDVIKIFAAKVENKTDHNHVVKQFKGKTLHPSDNVHPLVDVRNFSDGDNGGLIYQDFKTTQVYKDLKNTQPTTALTALSGFEEWVTMDIGTLIAMPINFPLLKDGDKSARNDSRLTGCVSLQFSKKYAISHSKVLQKINAILHRARWVMMDAVVIPSNNQWQATVSHEVKSDINLAFRSLQKLEATLAHDVDQMELVKSIKFWIQSAQDASSNLIDTFAGPANTDTPSSFVFNLERFRTEVNSFVDYTKLDMGPDSNITVNATFNNKVNDCQNLTLVGVDRVLGRVLRVLISNAFKFGRFYAKQYAKKKDPDEITINVGINITTILKEELPFIRIRITNSGDYNPVQTEVSGAKLGLSVASNYARLYQGDIDIESKDNQVSVTLLWPISNDLRERR